MLEKLPVDDHCELFRVRLADLINPQTEGFSQDNDVAKAKGSPTVAQSFRDNTSFRSIRTTDKNVSYWYLFSPNRPHPQDYSAWKFLYRSVPQRHIGVGLPSK
jgi:hypothetical protein